MVSELAKYAIQVPSTDSAVNVVVMVCDTAGMILLCNTCKTLILCNLFKNYSLLDANRYQYLYLQIPLTVVVGT